jgi:hypothetical protein
MRSKVIGTVATLATLAAWVSVLLSLHGGLRPRIDSRPHKATCWETAQEAGRQ